MKIAFVSASYAHRAALSSALDAIASAAEAANWRALIFVREYEFAPDDQQDMMATMQRDLRKADLLIAEVTYKAIGVGIEVGYAAALGLPILYVRRADAPPSTTVGGLATVTITYRTGDDLIASLPLILTQFA